MKSKIGRTTSTRPRRKPQADNLSSIAIDLDDEQSIAHWCEHFGVTRTQLAEAVLAAGAQSDAVREHLLNQGASAGAS